jgi:hypothetical protein
MPLKFKEFMTTNRGLFSKAFVFSVCLCSLVQAEYFTPLAKPATIAFKHNNGESQQFYYPEIVGSGVALFDYDKDGDLDIYMVQSGAFKDNKLADKFFKNKLNEDKTLSFIEVTSALNLQNLDYGMGVATADINQDGWVDLLITQFNHNKILLNQQGKSYQTSVMEGSNWSTGASYCDVNNDGLQDLYISNYVDWSQQNNPKCFNASSRRDYCGPNSFAGLKDVFYLNINKKLVNKTNKYFPKMPALPGLNVVCRDVNNDGWNDFIVANDGKANLLWLNQKGQYFKETGLFSGLAVNAQGVAEASMGMAIGDYDVDGDEDVFFTHLMGETNTLYNNNGKGLFQDVTSKTRLASQSFSYTGWSSYFLMVNNDLYPDLVVFNGAVEDTSSNDEEMNLEQANQLYLNHQGKQFKTVNNEKWLNQKDITRGVAFGDLDNDGDTDMVVNNNNGKAQILLNNLNPKKWIGLKLDDIANLRVLLSNSAHKYELNTHTDGSYASANDNRILLNQAQIENFQYIEFYTRNQLLKRMLLSTIPTNNYQSIELK